MTFLLPALFCIFSASNASAQEKNLLVINSYSEYSPWSQAMLKPIAFHLAQIEEVQCEVANLNNILIRDSLQYDQVINHLFTKYSNDHPEYVVLIGQMASTLFHRIKEEWGDIPMLFISRTDTYGPQDYYIASFDTISVDYSTFKPFEDMRKDYNFTIVYDRDYYKQTIDMMDQIMDAMDSLVFISDAVAISRTLSNEIEGYLHEFYPHVEYAWLQAKESNSDRLRKYVTQRSPKTGLLLSSWIYPVQGAQGYALPSSGDISILSGSINPIFALREADMSKGALGGVFPDYDAICNNITHVIDAMIAGKSMREMPIYDDLSSAPKLNYPELINYGISPSRCPDDSIFIDKPASFFDKYLWQIIVVVLVIIIFLILLIGKNMDQSRRIKTLERHKVFIENMPLPYTKAKIIMRNGEIVDVKHELMNDSYSRLFTENGYPESKKRFFEYPIIADHIKEALEKRSTVKFDYTFEKTGRVYEILFCVLKYSGGQQGNVLDVFAIDITERSKMEEELKELTRRFDKTINAANVIPWQWNLIDDTMVVDAYSLFQRYERDIDNLDEYYESTMSAKEFLAAVCEEDLPKLYEVRTKFLNNEIKEFNLEYRLKVARDGATEYEWVAVSGVVSERDADGKPIEVIGSMQLINN